MKIELHVLVNLTALAFSCITLATACCQTQHRSHYREIHEAAINGDAASVEADLRARPEDLNLPDDSGQTPLHLAAIHCRTNVVAVLLDKGADINARAKGKATPLHFAAQAGCTNALRMLLSKGAEVNPHDSQDRTPLARAKQWHQDAAEEILRQQGGVE